MHEEMNTIRDLMRTGNIAAAAERLQSRIALMPEDAEAKMLLGTCRHLLGDDEAFCRIDDELSGSPSARALPSWPRFHALRVAAAGGALILAGALADLRAEKFDMALYGGPFFDRKQLVVPTPSASDGKYANYVRVTWKQVTGAKFYKVRRATSFNYAKSKVIATVTGTSYKDKHPAAHPRKKYYYWIVPYVEAGQGKKNAARLDSGYAKQLLSVEAPGVMVVGGVWQFRVSGNKGQTLKPADCTWRIVSGSAFATLSRSGKLTAKKEGTVVVQAAYNGVKVRVSVRIEKFLYTLYGAPPFPVLTKYGGPPVTALEKVSSARMEMTVLPPEEIA